MLPSIIELLLEFVLARTIISAILDHHGTHGCACSIVALLAGYDGPSFRIS